MRCVPKNLVEKVSEYIYLLSPDIYYKLRRAYLKFFTTNEANEDKINSPIAGLIHNVNLELTIRCNLRCTFCWWWGERGIGKNLIEAKDSLITAELKSEEIFKIIDKLAQYHPNFYLSGGEPFIRKDTLDIIEYIASKGLKVGLTDNGTLLTDEIISRIAKINSLEITFSIDGPKEIHDKIRGKGSFEKTIYNINRLLQVRGNNKEFPKIMTNTTIAPENIDYLSDLIGFLDELKVDAIKLQHLWFTDVQKARKTESILAEIFKIENDNGPYSHIMENLDLKYAKKVADLVDIILRRSHKLSTPILFYPFLDKEEIIKYYTDINFTKYKKCIAPWNEITIKANGDVMFCPDEWITQFKLGNIKNDTIDELWNGDRAKLFRKFLLSNGKFPICDHCCFFYGGRG